MAATMEINNSSSNCLLPKSRNFISLIFWLLMVCSCNSITSRYFSGKTPYAWVHPDTESQIDEWYNLNDVEGSVCNAVHASAVIRHGARYPGLDDVNELINIHARLIIAMEPDINADFYEWKNRFPMNNNKALHHIGEDEQEGLGKRFGQRLHTLFGDEDLNNFRFIVSSMQRTKESASAFYEGFTSVIHSDTEIEDDFDSEVNDELMRFFALCAKYVYSVGKNKTAYKEYHDFLDGDHIKTVRSRIYEKLGVKDQEDLLSGADVRLIYLACGYETAAFESSPWCSLLDDDSMKIMDFLGDIRHSVKNGYIHNITWQQSCPLLSEIFFGFDETITEIESTEEDEEIEGFIVGQFAFGHAETIGPLYAILGLFNDSTPIRADSYKTQVDEERLFRASEILPFSANLAFVLYECVPEEMLMNEAVDELDEADYYLKMFINEKPHMIPGCDEMHCPYNKVREHYSNHIDRCEFNKLCKSSALKDEL